MTPKTSHYVIALKNLIAGLTKNHAQTTFRLAGVSYTTRELTRSIQAVIDAYDAVGPARGAYLNAARGAKALAASQNDVLRDLRRTLQLQAYDDPEILADYGLLPLKKTGPKTLRGKIEGADKGKATRIARHTRGPRQRAKVKAAKGG
jgi:hypothetical protein